MSEEKLHELITPKKNLFDVNFKEIWNYKDLLFLFVRRDFVAFFKQTILGPLWFFIQPIFTTIIFTVIFGKMANIPTDGTPQILFYMCGITCWNYFSDCMTKTSSTFSANAHIFGKVYFPRLILPLSIVISNLIKFSIQFLLFLAFLIYYNTKGITIIPNQYIVLFPLMIILLAGLGLGLGLIISSLTTKYRDLQFLVTFGVQLLMYATPIVYPLSLVKEKLGNYTWVTNLNPLSSIIEAIKNIFIGSGEIDFSGLGISAIFVIILLFTGIIIFNRVEKSFMDTV